MQALIEEFGQYLRHERGQSEHTQKAYGAILNRFADWAAEQPLSRWNDVELQHLLDYLSHRRDSPEPPPDDTPKNADVRAANRPSSAPKAFTSK